MIFDVSSGANIGTNITYNIDFAEVVGVTRAELKEMLKHYDVTPLAYKASLEVFYYLAESLKESSIIRDHIDGEGF